MTTQQLPAGTSRLAARALDAARITVPSSSLGCAKDLGPVNGTEEREPRPLEPPT